MAARHSSHSALTCRACIPRQSPPAYSSRFEKRNFLTLSEVVRARLSSLKRVHFDSVGIRLRAHNPNAMINEKGVHARELYARHMARDAILAVNGACFAGVIVRNFLRSRRNMTSQAFVVIPGGIMVQRFVGVVASDASKACIAIAPAFAVLQTIRLKAHIRHAANPQLIYVVQGAMAGPTKIDLSHRTQANWIENGLTALFIFFVVHQLRVPGARTVTRLAIHSERETSRIKSRSGRRGGRMAAEAVAQGIRIEKAAQGLIESSRSLG